MIRKYMQKIASITTEVFDRQSKEWRNFGGQAFWPRLYIYNTVQNNVAFHGKLYFKTRKLNELLPKFFLFTFSHNMFMASGNNSLHSNISTKNLKKKQTSFVP